MLPTSKPMAMSGLQWALSCQMDNGGRDGEKELGGKGGCSLRNMTPDPGKWREACLLKPTALSRASWLSASPSSRDNQEVHQLKVKEWVGLEALGIRLQEGASPGKAFLPPC